jgi:hypothetical protein
VNFRFRAREFGRWETLSLRDIKAIVRQLTGPLEPVWSRPIWIRISDGGGGTYLEIDCALHPSREVALIAAMAENGWEHTRTDSR